jgi:hypothetical protein
MIVARIRMHPKMARNSFSAALILIGVLALYNWVLAPHLGYLHAMQQYSSVVNRVVEEKNRISDTLDTKVQQWHLLQAEMTELDEGLFPAEEARTLIRNLLPLAEETGCTVVMADFADKSKPGPAPEPNRPATVAASRVTLDVAGPFDRVSALLQRFRDHRPRIWVNSCQLDFSGGASEALACHLTLTLYVTGEEQAHD